ncbi:MAG: hypothetical protein WCD70_11425 [Alphaproteobacteria bacterium]
MVDTFANSTAQKIADVMTGITQGRLPDHKWAVYGRADLSDNTVRLIGADGSDTAKSELSYAQYSALMKTFRNMGVGENAGGRSATSPTGFTIGGHSSHAPKIRASLFDIAEDAQAQQDLKWLQDNQIKLRETFNLNLTLAKKAENQAKRRAADKLKADTDAMAQKIAAANGTASTANTGPAPEGSEETFIQQGAPAQAPKTTADNTKFTDDQMKALQDFGDRHVDNHYSWEWKSPTNQHLGGTFFYHPETKDGTQREAITVKPEGITIHPTASPEEISRMLQTGKHDAGLHKARIRARDEATEHSIQLAVQMYGGSIIINSTNHGHALKVEQMAQQMLLKGQLTDKNGNVHTVDGFLKHPVTGEYIKDEKTGEKVKHEVLVNGQPLSQFTMSAAAARGPKAAAGASAGGPNP